MPNVVSLNVARDELRQKMHAVLIAALEGLLDCIADLRVGATSEDISPYWPMSKETCVRLIICNAVALRPSLETSAAERRLLVPMLAEVEGLLAQRLAS